MNPDILINKDTPMEPRPETDVFPPPRKSVSENRKSIIFQRLSTPKLFLSFHNPKQQHSFSLYSLSSFAYNIFPASFFGSSGIQRISK